MTERNARERCAPRASSARAATAGLMQGCESRRRFSQRFDAAAPARGPGQLRIGVAEKRDQIQ